MLTLFLRQAQYVLDNDLGGWTMWTLDMDDFNAEFCGLGAYPVLTTLNQVTNPNFAGTMPLKKKKNWFWSRFSGTSIVTHSVWQQSS